METVEFRAMEAPVRGYLWDDYDTLEAHKRRPALIICPGGAYRWRSPREKDAPALEFLSMGYQVFILEYSCAERAGEYRPLRELAEAVRQLRERSAEWHIDGSKIAVMGFSAGGHLAASLGAFWNDREHAAVRCHPVFVDFPV